MNILVMGNGSLSVAAQEQKLCIEFAKKGHKVYLVCNEDLRLFDVGEIEKHKNLIIINIPYSEYQFEKLNIPEKIDICFGMDQSVSHFVADYKQRMRVKSFCMFLDFPVHVIDGNDPINYNFGYSQRFYYWINCALSLDGVIFNNGVAVEEFYKRYKRDAHLVFYSISSDSNYESLKEEPSSKDYFLGCNRIIKYKGTDLVLKALRKLPYSYKHIFVSADDKELANLKAISEGLPNSIVFYNRVGETEKMRLTYNAKLMVYPQVTEWIGGLSIIEGMSVKTPGICFDYPVLRELYGDCVLYVKKKSVFDLRDKVKQLYEDKELNEELAEKGYERFKKLFTREVMAENLLEVFTKEN
jgi:glycosyltransferase involved in cell wall biosynthesis